jgi:hypothetical protein
MALKRTAPAPGMLARDYNHIIEEPFHFGVIFNDIDCVAMVHGEVKDFLKI